MSIDPPEERQRYDDYTLVSDRYPQATWIGTRGGAPAPVHVFYDGESNTVFRAEVNDEDRELVPVSGSDRELDPGETLADALEEIGDRTGWESLSDWAEEHLEDDE